MYMYVHNYSRMIVLSNVIICMCDCMHVSAAISMGDIDAVEFAVIFPGEYHLNFSCGTEENVWPSK